MKPDLQLEHLSPYLPYGLKIVGHDLARVEELETLTSYSVNIKGRGWTYGMWADISDIKPLLLPLSEFNDSAANDEIYKLTGSYYSMHPDFSTPLELPYYIVEILCKHHFDVFGLIDDGLAFNKAEMEADHAP